MHRRSLLYGAGVMFSKSSLCPVRLSGSARHFQGSLRTTQQIPTSQHQGLGRLSDDSPTWSGRAKHQPWFASHQPRSVFEKSISLSLKRSLHSHRHRHLTSHSRTSFDAPAVPDIQPPLSPSISICLPPNSAGHVPTQMKASKRAAAYARHHLSVFASSLSDRIPHRRTSLPLQPSHLLFCEKSAELQRYQHGKPPCKTSETFEHPQQTKQSSKQYEPQDEWQSLHHNPQKPLL